MMMIDLQTWSEHFYFLIAQIENKCNTHGTTRSAYEILSGKPQREEVT